MDHPTDDYDEPPLAPYPTSAPPGSHEKLAVMADRHDHGYRLFHPGDATLLDGYNSLRWSWLNNIPGRLPQANMPDEGEES